MQLRALKKLRHPPMQEGTQDRHRTVDSVDPRILPVLTEGVSTFEIKTSFFEILFQK